MVRRLFASSASHKSSNARWSGRRWCALQVPVPSEILLAAGQGSDMLRLGRPIQLASSFSFDSINRAVVEWVVRGLPVRESGARFNH